MLAAKREAVNTEAPIDRFMTVSLEMIGYSIDAEAMGDLTAII